MHLNLNLEVNILSQRQLNVLGAILLKALYEKMDFELEAEVLLLERVDNLRSVEPVRHV